MDKMVVYLAEYLLDLGYEVHGIIRRNSTFQSISKAVLMIQGLT
jgi:GDP-D-mannose dehydratase